MERTTNFNAGPAALPLEVLQKAQKEFIDFNESGMSVMELSHRSKEYEAVHQKAKSLLIELMGIPEDYDILFLQGGASLQFSMLPMNFLTPEKTAHFVMTGAWSEKHWQKRNCSGTRLSPLQVKQTITVIFQRLTLRM